MPTKKTSSSKKRVAVKDLPATRKKIGSKEMKRVKGGVVLCKSGQQGIVLCKTNTSGIVLCKS